jgi:chemotaxis protein methyltransferase CheR
MTEQEFDVVRKLLREQSAVVLDKDKQYLVEARLQPLARRRQMATVGELITRLARDGGPELRTEVVEAMVTTETSFFRDHHPFEALRKTGLPELIAKRRAERRLNIWCAASSTGQEPYSLALTIREHFPELSGWKVMLLSTDISGEMLARAREGVYNQAEVNRGLPAALLVKHFEQRGTDWQLGEAVRRMVSFQQLNLAGQWPVLPPMDLVLLRNVMIYFDVETKKTILDKLTRTLRPDGYLLLGGSETTFNIDNRFERVEPIKSGFYRLVGRTAE